MEIQIENNKEGRVIDHRTYVVDKYRKSKKKKILIFYKKKNLKIFQ